MFDIQDTKELKESSRKYLLGNIHTYVSYFAVNFLQVENENSEWQGYLCCSSGALTHVGTFKASLSLRIIDFIQPKATEIRNVELMTDIMGMLWLALPS